MTLLCARCGIRYDDELQLTMCPHRLRVKAPLGQADHRARSVGFTGTRLGMTIYQKGKVAGLLLGLRSQGYLYFHHGGCTGADEEAHAIAVRMGYATVVHWSDLVNFRANLAFDYEVAPKAPLVRNKDIVDQVSLMLACPHEAKEQSRSGTWSTIRYARRAGVRLEEVTP